MNSQRRRIKEMSEGASEQLRSMERKGRTIVFRARTDGQASGDECILREVLDRNSYVMKGIGFDVLPGERWLDLGANIGAFAIYCLEKGASVVCYEPDPECFAILQRNVPEAELHQAAVTNSRAEEIEFFTSPNETNHSRGTTRAVRGYRSLGALRNCYMGNLTDLYFDGIKMDIEGAEAGILDDQLLPKCKKLVIEYHTSRDSRVDKLASRVSFLKQRFALVKYPSEFDKAIAQGLESYKAWFDRLFFCKAEEAT